MTTMTLSYLKNPYAELQMEGAIEEIRKDRRVYQKRWKLNFRSVLTMKTIQLCPFLQDVILVSGVPSMYL